MKTMSTPCIFALLGLAAGLEVGGDFLVRCGLDSNSPVKHYFFLILGGVVLYLYGYTVNSAPWDFGRLLGTYVVLFFLVAQLIEFFSKRKLPAGLIFLFTGELPAGLMLAGSLLIVIGGILFAVGQHLMPILPQAK